MNLLVTSGLDLVADSKVHHSIQPIAKFSMQRLRVAACCEHGIFTASSRFSIVGVLWRGEFIVSGVFTAMHNRDAKSSRPAKIVLFFPTPLVLRAGMVLGVFLADVREHSFHNRKVLEMRGSGKRKERETDSGAGAKFSSSRLSRP